MNIYEETFHNKNMLGSKTEGLSNNQRSVLLWNDTVFQAVLPVCLRLSSKGKKLPVLQKLVHSQVIYFILFTV